MAVFTLLWALGPLEPSWTKDKVYYRYQDEQGIWITSTTLPPHIANKGYQRVTQRGNVIETVAPKRTQTQIKQAQEKARLKQQEREQWAKEKRKIELQKQKDQVLLQSYSSISDLERSRDNKIASIEILENITHENIIRLQSQLLDAKKAAAEFERAGKALPQKILFTIEQSQRQIHENQLFLKQKESEKTNIIDKYRDDILRFEILKNQKKMRNLQ